MIKAEIIRLISGIRKIKNKEDKDMMLETLTETMILEDIVKSKKFS